MLKVYEYNKCSTCVKAVKFLKTTSAQFELHPIVEQAPSIEELKAALQHLKTQDGGIKNLFNTSGLVYKELKLAEKLPTMTEAECLKLLASNGKLVKRPFVIGKNKKQDVFLIGFKEDQWKKALS